MSTRRDQRRSRIWATFSRPKIAAILIAIGSIGVPTLVPLIWPQLDRTIGIVLLGVCILGLAAAALLIITSDHSSGLEPKRSWKIVGIGQGWIEARVRNNEGDELVVAWNEGGGNDRVSTDVSFKRRRAPRKSDTVELIFDIDGDTFEWDLVDHGETCFSINGETWRDVDALKLMLSSIRDGNSLLIAVPSLDLRASFTLEDAFDVLQGVQTVGSPSFDLS